MRIIQGEGECVVMEVPDTGPNGYGEYLLPDIQLKDISGFTEDFRAELDVTDETGKAKKALPHTNSSKTTVLAFEKRDDGAKVHSVLVESDYGMYYEPIRVPNKAISISEFPDGTVRGKTHFYRNCDGSRGVGVAHRPSESDLAVIRKVQTAFSYKKLVEQFA